MDPDDWVNKMELDTGNVLGFNKEPDYSNIQDDLFQQGICFSAIFLPHLPRNMHRTYIELAFQLFV